MVDISKATARPWEQSGVMIWSPSGKANVAAMSEPRPPDSDAIGYYPVGWGKGFNEAAANAALIVTAVNERDALIAERDQLRDACLFVKDFLRKLEEDGGYHDPLQEARRKFHAPLHAKLNAALGVED